jgi:isocitrate lyase
MLGHVTGIASLPVQEQIRRLEDIRMQFSLTGRQPASDSIRI